MARPPVGELIAVVTDRGSWASWDTPPTDPPGISDAYASDLAAARSATGLDESVVTGEATLAGRRVALIAGDPRFLGGSIGVATAVRLADAIARATREGLPLLALPVGGGTRMQEGTLAFLQMAKITQAVMDHKAAGLPYLVYLRHPTMGGVFASWASLGHVTLAEPGALLGFLGPRVYEALYGRPFPSGVQLAENLEARGIVDAVVPPDQVRSAWARILQVVAREPGEGASAAASAAEPDRGPSPDPDPDDLTYTPAWTSVLATRRPDRPGVRFLLAGATDVTMLNGTGDGESHPGSVLALARIGGEPCVVLGQCREGQTLENPLDAAALREARRGLRLSRELRLPLLTVIDTPGAALSKEAEERGLAGEIARTLSELLTLPTPTVSLLMGQGAGGIALALVPADRVLASEHAWLAPLPPEGASAIVHRDTEHAAELAGAQGVRARDLLRNGIVDRVVPEPPDAAADPDAFRAGLLDAVSAELRRVVSADGELRLAERAEKYRTLGVR